MAVVVLVNSITPSMKTNIFFLHWYWKKCLVFICTSSSSWRILFWLSVLANISCDTPASLQQKVSGLFSRESIHVHTPMKTSQRYNIVLLVSSHWPHASYFSVFPKKKKKISALVVNQNSNRRCVCLEPLLFGPQWRRTSKKLRPKKPNSWKITTGERTSAENIACWRGKFIVEVNQIQFEQNEAQWCWSSHVTVVMVQ